MSVEERRVHFVRHAESTFNEVHHLDPEGSAPTSTRFIDAPLSVKGEQQAKEAREEISRLKVDLAISSPFMRALSTSLLAHGDHNLLITPLCRERFESVCDIGTTKEELVKKFPGLNFDHIPKQIWWYVGTQGIQHNITDLQSAIQWFQSNRYTVESDEILRARADEFYQLLLTRPEKSIVVFSHSHFLRKFLHWHFGTKNLSIHNAEVISFPLPLVDN